MTEPSFGRRQAGLLGVALLAGCAQPGDAQAQANLAQAGRPSRGQPAGSPRVVRAVPPPCLERDGDLAAVLLEGSGNTVPAIVVFGLPLAPGQLPRGAALSARRAGGGDLAAQVDVASRHPDGSARQAVVSLQAPALRRDERLGVILARLATPPAPALGLEAALAGRTAVLELSGATPWRLDLLAALRAAPATGWQDGPLAVQRRVALPVPAEAVGGATSLRLVADVAARADGTLWVDLWLRNDVAMREGGGPASYTARLLLDGQEALRVEMPRHHQYRAWGRLLGALPGGRPVPPAPLVRHDVAALAETGAIARYDLSIGVTEDLLAGMGQQVAAAEWRQPFAARGILPYMQTSGGRFDLGPTTGQQAAWLTTGDRRAAEFCIGQAEAAAGIPWHFWDAAGGAGDQGGWLDAQRWPRLWTDGRGGRPPRGLMQPMPGDTGWSLDPAHQPDLAFVPYLLTGRHALADEVMAQGAWNLVTVWPAVRNPSGMSEREEGFLVVQGRQVRGASWSIRQLDEAAWAAPDGDPSQPALQQAARRNWAWLRGRIPLLTEAQGEPHGWLVPNELGQGGVILSPWQQDYFASAAAAAARQGNDDARAVLGWMSNFLVGRFEAADRGFARNDGAAYVIIMGQAEGPAIEGPGGQKVRPIRSWAEAGAATRARGFSNETGWKKSDGEYARLALQSLAQISDILDNPRARRAYDWLAGAGAPYTDAAARARNPTLNIVPRGLATAQARGCPQPAAR